MIKRDRAPRAGGFGWTEARAAAGGNELLLGRPNNEQIVKGAFRQTITAWADTGRRVPLHWDHRAEPSNVIGWVNPLTMRETSCALLMRTQRSGGAASHCHFLLGMQARFSYAIRIARSLSRPDRAEKTNPDEIPDLEYQHRCF
jgi:hypothetical protein